MISLADLLMPLKFGGVLLCVAAVLAYGAWRMRERRGARTCLTGLAFLFALGGVWGVVMFLSDLLNPGVRRSLTPEAKRFFFLLLIPFRATG